MKTQGSRWKSDRMCPFFFLLFWHVSRCCTCLEKISLGPFVQTSSTQPKMKKNWSVKTREKFFCLEVFRSTTRLNGGENYISVQTDPSFLFPETERERELFIRKKKERTSRERERGAALVRANKAWRLIFFFVFLLPFWFLDCALPPCWLGKTEDGQIRRSHCEFKIPPLSLSPLTPHPVKEGSCFCFDLSPG